MQGNMIGIIVFLLLPTGKIVLVSASAYKPRARRRSRQAVAVRCS